MLSILSVYPLLSYPLALAVSPDMKILLGLGLVGGALALSSATVRSKLSGGFSSLLSRILPDRTNPDSRPASPDDLSSLTVKSCMQAHQAISALMTYFVRRGDEKGGQLAAAIGQHVYSEQIEDAKKKQPVVSDEQIAANVVRNRAEWADRIDQPK